MAISNAAWDGAASNYKDTDAYCSACLIDLNKPGEKKKQDNCKLPIKEPHWDINKNSLPAALGRLPQTDAPVPAKKAAARKLLAAYQEAKMDVPDSLKKLVQ